jgi:hypothetical protein
MINYLSEDECQVVASDLRGLSDDQLVGAAQRYKDMPTCLKLTLNEIKNRLRLKDFVTSKELSQVRNELSSLTAEIREDRLNNTKRSKAAQDIISYELEAIKAQLPSLDRGALKSQNEERLKRFKEDIRNLRDVFKKN